MSIGLSKSKAKAETKFDVTRTGGTSFSPSSGTLDFDPRISGLRDQSLGTFQGGAQEALGQFGGLRRRVEDSAFGLEAARVSPILREAALQQGAIRQDLGRRNLGGSSFLDQALGRSAQQFAGREGEARSLAQQDIVNILSQLTQGGFGVSKGLAGFENQIAQQRLAQDLAGLEFGKGQKSKSKSASASFGFTGGASSTADADIGES